MPTDRPEGTICTRYKDGVCPDSDECPYAHPWEGTVGSHSSALIYALTPVGRDRQHKNANRGNDFPYLDTSGVILSASADVSCDGHERC